jgi:hypothetical protein
LQELGAWRPVPESPSLHVPVNPDATVYVAALALALVSGFLFGIVPVRQVLRTDPYQIVKSGSTGRGGRRITVRDLLLGVQIAICAVLVTCSLVAVRGLVRSRSGNSGFEPRNAMLANTVLSMAGYSGDRVPAMQRRMIESTFQFCTLEDFRGDPGLTLELAARHRPAFGRWPFWNRESAAAAGKGSYMPPRAAPVGRGGVARHNRPQAKRTLTWLAGEYPQDRLYRPELAKLQ